MTIAARAHCANRVALWQRFNEGPLTMPETPGAREAWHQGRPRFAVWLLRLSSGEVRERAEMVAAALGDSVVPQPASDLHVTVFVAGFPAETVVANDDVLASQLEAQAEALGRQGRAFLLRVGGASSFLSAPFLEVEDTAGGLSALRALLARHAPEIRFAAYHPHVTVGRYQVATSTTPLADALRPFRDLPSLPLAISEAELVTLDSYLPGAPLVTQKLVKLRSP